MASEYLDVSDYNPSEFLIKTYRICCQLDDMGYNDECENEQDVIRIIERDKLDVSQFDFPGGNFEAFKNLAFKKIFAAQ